MFLWLQGIECCLGAIQPSAGTWSEEVKEKLEELTHEKLVEL